MVAELRGMVAGLQATIAELNGTIAGLNGMVAQLHETVASRDARIAELEKLLEETRRSGRRQSAPCSKGEPSVEPARPGRKSGEDHGRHGHRAVPVGPPDRELEALLPGCCPHCGGEVEFEREDEQWQVDSPIRPVTTRFRVRVGRCRRCRLRVQGRHPEPTRRTPSCARPSY